MAQSLVAAYIHLVFHVKTTSVAIQEYDQEKLFAYVAGLVNKNGCTSIRVGGVRDHIHVLLGLSSTMTIADLVEKIKYASNKYLKELAPGYRGFAWQAGYGAFSVSPKDLDAAKEYVANQREHHKHKNFNEEYLRFLQQYGVDYKEEYVFRD